MQFCALSLSLYIYIYIYVDILVKINGEDNFGAPVVKQLVRIIMNDVYLLYTSNEEITILMHKDIIYLFSILSAFFSIHCRIQVFSKDL